MLNKNIVGNSYAPKTKFKKLGKAVINAKKVSQAAGID